jgi:hypothetical protein
MIFKIETYANDQGAVIQAKYGCEIAPFGGEPKLSPPIFISGGFLQFHTPQGPGQFPFQFEIPGVNVGEAFANYPAAFEAAKQKAAVDFRQQYAAEQTAQAQRLIMPNGQPVNRIH